MRYLLSVMIFFSTLTLYSQRAKLDTSKSMSNLKSAAGKMKQSLLDRDYITFVEYVHPEVAKIAGGKEKLIELTKESYKVLEIEGYKISAVAIEFPAAIIESTPNNLQTVVQEKLSLKNKKGLLISISYLIAISNDLGANWVFIETGGKSLDQMKSVFPFLNNDLIIPKKEKPIFYKDEK